MTVVSSQVSELVHSLQYQSQGVCLPVQISRQVRILTYLVAVCSDMRTLSSLATKQSA